MNIFEAQERTAEFPVDPNDDVSGAVSSASSGPLKDYQEGLAMSTRKTEPGAIAVGGSAPTWLHMCDGQTTCAFYLGLT